MTVIQLIAKLATLPPDAVVIYQQYSEYEELTEEDLEVVHDDAMQIIQHHGRYMRHKGAWGPLPEGSKYVTVVELPGN